MRDTLDTAECHPGRSVGRPRDGLSQRELAAQAGLSVGAVRDLEQGRTAWPREQSVLRLARALSLGQRERDELAALRAAAAGGRAVIKNCGSYTATTDNTSHPCQWSPNAKEKGGNYCSRAWQYNGGGNYEEIAEECIDAHS
jgi:transcriptional regulator with XRE-family HTH domain